MLKIDTREPLSYRTEVARLLPDADCTEGALFTGDYLWSTPTGDVIVERKELHTDLLASIQTPRWAEQTSRLADFTREGALAVILVEGDMEFSGDTLVLPDRGISRWSRDGILNTLLVAQMRGITVTSSGRGPHAVAKRISSLYHLTQREDHQTTVRRHSRPLGEMTQDEAQALGILSSLPGCGLPTAKKLLQEYGSAGNAIKAILDPDVQVPGVTTTRLMRWYNSLTWRYQHGRASDSTAPGSAPIGEAIGSGPRQHQDGSALRGSRK